VYVGWNWADGYDPAFIVVIAHASNLTTWYAHLQARYQVSAGQIVSAGQVIGYEGNTGHSTGAHLHWVVQLNGKSLNPRLFV
jgi:murein DD-endopeptidase MepM/ murein hydrolase activator NlpD